jgi:hypothetical protein
MVGDARGRHRRRGRAGSGMGGRSVDGATRIPEVSGDATRDAVSLPQFGGQASYSSGRVPVDSCAKRREHRKERRR